MNHDIIALLNRIKKNISAIESGDERVSTLNEVNNDFIRMIELIKLFLISERDSYYGYFLMNMQFHVDFHGNSIAGIKLNTFPPTLETNPLLLCKFTLKEILYIICHEIDHVVLNHPAAMIKENPTNDIDVFYQFNLAADAAVNDLLDYEIEQEHHRFLSRPNGAVTSDVLSKMFHLGKINAMDNYAYYFGLIKGKSSNYDLPMNGAQSILSEQNKKDDSKGDENSCDSCDPNQGETSPEDVYDEVPDTTEKEIVTANNCEDYVVDHNWDAGEDEEDASATVRQFVNSAVGIMSEETRGMMPANFISQVEKLNKPPVLSWQKILKKYIGTISANKRKTRMRLNRRQPERFDLLGRMDDKVLKIVVAIDTSASVDDHMIGKIFNEIFEILAKRKHDITVIECDAEVQRVYKAKTPADIKQIVKGRGGTLFSPVIEYINNDKYYRDALLIYFTDGYGELEISRPRTYRNIWVVIDNSNHLSLKEPYGTVLEMETN